MVVVSNHLLVFHMFQHKFQDDRFCDLTRHGGEVGWLVITSSSELEIY